jgi:hypothetical protein
VIELGEYGLLCQPKLAIKGQALTDFIAKCSFKNNDQDKPVLATE